ncbi:MAG: hypothetical protein LWX83_06615 [Anaerolineae bacterium]|nr:hypothetical protein [Anaerolineae bacterium]
MSDTPAVKRSRGAQPGNINAIKQGFYAQHFNPEEISGLENIEKFTLLDEIAMLRVLIRRVVDKSAANTTILEDIESLRQVSIASLCLNRLVRTHLILPRPGSKTVLDHALRELDELIEDCDRRFPPGKYK